jgi:DNA (cytosine-5)-methyltransferase 1
MRTLPSCDVVAAGFPCQDLSQAGRTAGIDGQNSGLVQRVFELLQTSRCEPMWLAGERPVHAPARPRACEMDCLATTLEDLGYRWAYRVAIHALSYCLNAASA